jgi:transcriptional regulator with XRE-family HTH domain
MENFREVFGSRLKQLRKSRNLSQKKLGEIIGLSNNAISLYESAKHEPLFEHLVHISRFFNVSIESLLNISEDLHVDEYDTVIYLAKQSNIKPDTLRNIIFEISKYKSDPDDQ